MQDIGLLLIFYYDLLLCWFGSVYFIRTRQGVSNSFCGFRSHVSFQNLYGAHDEVPFQSTNMAILL